MEIRAPKRVTAGDDFTIAGTGFDDFAPYVRVSVGYPRRAELYKASVARLDNPDEDPKKVRKFQPQFQPGEISLTEVAAEAGEAVITVWDWPQRRQLATTTVTVRE